MPSSRVTANTVAQTIVTAPKIKSGKVVSIHINNRHTAAIQVTLQDVFRITGDAADTTVTKKTFVPVPAGESFNLFWEKPEIEFNAALKTVADITQATCEIVVSYEWK